MHFKYKITIFITILLIGLSVGSSVLSYFSALNAMERQLKNSSMPLTIDNTYTEIQKNILEPRLVASMMANDTFLHTWLKNGEKNLDEIGSYLKNIQKKYGLLSTFFVSEKSKNYYTPKGIIYKVKEDVKENAWYYDFKKSTQMSEINLDTNEHIDKSMILFINNKVMEDGHYLGAIGVALKISYIDYMLEHFHKEHHFTVYFTDEMGKVVLSHKETNGLKHIDDDKDIKRFKDKIFSQSDEVYEYMKNDQKHFLTSKYIEELNLYVIVQAQSSHFTKNFRESLSTYIAISTLVAILFIIFILIALRSHHKKLEQLADFDTLTGLANRRTFNTHFDKIFALSQRRESSFSLLFIDVDDFKSINDTFGHGVGDLVLQRLALLLKEYVRASDVLARWGGEEFAILLPDTLSSDAATIAETLRQSIQEDQTLIDLTTKKVTVSIGITSLVETDTIDVIFTRADKALYEAKAQGKNSVILS